MNLLTRSRYFLSVFVFFVFAVVASPSLADRAGVVCVQSELKELGYNPGTNDGVLGDRTRSAMSAYVSAMQAKTDANWSMPALTTASANHICQLIADAFPEVSRFWLAIDVINGLDVAAVSFKSTPDSRFGTYEGTYRNIGNGRWRETSTKASFNFVEKSRTTERITLWDETRNLTVLIWVTIGGDIAFVYEGGPVTTFATVTRLERGAAQ